MSHTSAKYQLQIAANQHLKERAYWLDRLAGDLEKTGFPYDSRTNHLETGNDWAIVTCAWTGPFFSRLNALAGGSDYALQIILICGLVLLLNKYTGSSDIIVGTPVYKQDNSQGDMINKVLAVRLIIPRAMTMKDLLLQARSAMSDAQENANYPIEVLIDQLKTGKSLSSADNELLFDVVVLLENIQDKEYIRHIPRNIVFCFSRVGERLELLVEYNGLFYKKATIERIVRHFKHLAQNTLTDIDTRLSSVDALSGEDRRLLLEEFNQTRTPYPADRTIAQLFQEQVQKTPDSTALVFEDCSLTYQALNRRANALAGKLRKKGAAPDSIVGLFIRRSLEMITGIMGILKAGGAYLPIEPGTPRQRVRFMLEDCRVSLLVTGSHGIEINRKIHIIKLEVLQEEPDSENSYYNRSTSLAYVIFTSGTTGKPRGILTTHANAVRVVKNTNYIEIKPGDRILQLSNYAFDGSIFDIYGALLNGAPLVLLKPANLLSVDNLANLVKKENITVFFVTTALFNAITDMNIEVFQQVRKVLFGGERVSVGHVKRAWQYLGKDRIVHMYGPTETTVYATYYNINQIQEPINTIPIGKPISNTTLYILDKNLNPVPIGVPGEIYIGGDGLSRGYLNQPELTAQKFLYRTDRFYRSYGSYKTYILYKTGDWGRWLDSGNMEFLDRIDEQVKIRGFRVELGEIRTRLLSCPGVNQALVLLKTSTTRGVCGDETEDKYLCAYIVPQPGRDVTADQVREHLTRYLPEYMIPTFFIPLDKLPLTPNGKVNRNALPEPGIETGQAYEPPGTRLEKKLAAIWSDVLGKEKTGIGIHHHFFQIGGHSLKAARLVYQVYKELELELEIADVFANPTIKELADHLEKLEKTRYIGIRPGEEKEYYELSHAQRRLWVLSQSEAASIAYNMPGILVISGDFKIDAFMRAVRTLVRRHESLRTIFIPVDGQPRQKIVKYTQYQPDMDRQDLRDLREEEIRKIYNEFAYRAFDLEKGPLIRLKLAALEEKKYLLIFNIHHIINDGWSQGNLQVEIIRLYNAISCNQESPLSELRLQYKDYTHWHRQLIRRGHWDRARDYWLNRLQDKPKGIQLPLDYPRQPVGTLNGSQVSFTIKKEKTIHLRQLSLRKGATLFMSLLTLLYIFLNRYTGQEDIIVGSPTAARKHPELQDMIGFLVNTLVFRTRVVPHRSFNQLLTDVKQETLAAYKHQDYPFDLIVEQLEMDRDLTQSPLFNVMLAHNNTGTRDTKLEMQGVTVSNYPHSHENNISKFDLLFFMDELEHQVSIRVQYNSDLFSEQTIREMPGSFLTLVDSILEDPNAPTATLPILSPAQYRRIIHQFNDTRCQFSRDSLQQLLETRAKQSPHRVAVVDKAEQITYRELNRKTHALACYIRGKYRVRANDIIALSMERSLALIIALIGILKTGAAYLAIDPAYPGNRISYMLKDSNPRLLITANHKKNGQRLLYQGNILEIETGWENTTREYIEASPAINQPGDTVYVTYTSGSTGTPHGVLVNHGILTNLIRWQQEKTSIDSSMRTLQFASINFDVSFQEIMSTLTAGGELHLIGEMERKHRDYLMDFLCTHRIGVLYLPFYYLNFLFSEPVRPDSFRHSLKHLVTAGEQLIITPGLKSFLEANPGIRLHNHYGPAEMHVVTSYTMDAAAAGKNHLPPIGKPIANVNIYILDEHLCPVPIGVWGELYIAGPGGFKGYLNKPGTTAEKFRSAFHKSYRSNRSYSPPKKYNQKFLRGGPGGAVFSKSAPPGRRRQKEYKTGDLGRWRQDGNIQFKGRKDTQVKIRGFRVEPGEIQSKILANEKVRECVVVVKKDKNRQNYLAAYLVGQQIEPKKIRKIISRDLPQYMVPRLKVLDRLPLMPNGKIDREKLPEPDHEPLNDYIAPRDKTEEKLAGLWADILAIDREKIGIETNFFEIGGHSLKATSLVLRIHKEFHVKMPIEEVFKHPFIRHLSQYIKNEKKEIFSAIKPVEKSDYYPLSPAQQRLYIRQHVRLYSKEYNLPYVVQLQGELDKNRLTQAFHRLIRRHESLRTSIHMFDERPVQRIHDEVEFEIEYEEVEEERPAAVLISSFIRPFDLSRAPLMRVGLIKLPHTPPALRGHPRRGTYNSQEGKENQHILIVDMHHIVTDGISHPIIANDFITFYHGGEMPGLKLQYKDYSRWQNNKLNTGEMKKQKTYWLQRYKGNIPDLDMPVDFPRQEIEKDEGDRVNETLPASLVNSINRLAKTTGVTLFMVYLAAYHILLTKYTRQQDIIIGTAISGRNHADLEQIIGIFVNLLALRNISRETMSFREFLQEVKENALNAYKNQDYQFEELVDQLGLERKPGKGMLFDVAFTVETINQKFLQGGPGGTVFSKGGWHPQPIHGQPDDVLSGALSQKFAEKTKFQKVLIKSAPPGLKILPYNYQLNIARYDLLLKITGTEEQGHLILIYRKSLFKRATVEQLKNHYIEILNQVAGNIDIKLEQVKISHDLLAARSSVIPGEDDGFDF